MHLTLPPGTTRLRGVVSFPHLTPWTLCTDMPLTATGRRYVFARPTMARPCLSIVTEAQRSTLRDFAHALADKRIRVTDGIHFFDAHRLEPSLLSARDLQLNSRETTAPGLTGAEEEVDDPDTEPEVSSSEEEYDTAPNPDDGEPWCPPIPEELADPTEEELAGAAEKLDTLVPQYKKNPEFFFTPANFGALPTLWLQARLTIEFRPFLDKMAKILNLVAAELWLRQDEANIQNTITGVARSMTVRLAEHLAQYITGLMRHASSLATPHTQCLLYATYWVRPILSELLGAAKEEVGPNKDRAPCGPVSGQPCCPAARGGGLTVVTRASALIAWFPASWASKIAPCFQQDTAGSYQSVQTVRIQSVRGSQRPRPADVGGEGAGGAHGWPPPSSPFCR